MRASSPGILSTARCIRYAPGAFCILTASGDAHAAHSTGPHIASHADTATIDTTAANGWRKERRQLDVARREHHVRQPSMGWCGSV